MSQNNSYTSLTSTGHSAFAGDLSLDRSAVSDDGRGGVGVTNFAEQRKRKRQIDARVIRSSLDIRAKTSVVKPLTQPKEFNFATAYRARPTRFLSPEEREQQELESRTQFRANPLPVHTSSSSTTSAPIFKRPPTEPQSPMLHTTARLGKKRRLEAPSVENNTQHHHNNNNTASDAGGGKRHKCAPRPFQLMTDLRGQQTREALERARLEERRREEELRRFRARPLPEGDAFRPAPSAAPLTRPKPYPLRTEDRGHVKQESLARRLEGERRREAELRRFNARPLPDGDAFQPAPSAAPLTDPKPFPLRTEERGVEKVLTLQHSLAAAAEQDKENRQFKALPLPTDAPFKPRPSTRPLTELDEFNLQSDSRAAQRAAFEERMRAKEAAEAEARRQAQLAREREEEREVRRLRERLVHRARPIPLSVYQPMQALPSAKALTEPASPCLGLKRRKQADSFQRS